MNFRFAWITLTASVMTTAAGAAYADIATYYIGVDGRQTPFQAPASLGGGAYPDNPNLNRLTLLLHHGDHYHGIGSYSYGGPAAQPALADTNTNNRLPETFTGLAPLSLRLSSGSGWNGTYRSGLSSILPQDVEYGNLELRNVHSLASEDPVTYNSSSGRWTTSFDSADIYLQLVSISDGLRVSDSAVPTQTIPVGGEWRLGSGADAFQKLPVFWVDAEAAWGDRYSAEFRLLDQSGNFGNSGRFFVDLEVVPEPGSWALLLASLGLMGAMAARRSRPETTA